MNLHGCPSEVEGQPLLLKALRTQDSSDVRILFIYSCLSYCFVLRQDLVNLFGLTSDLLCSPSWSWTLNPSLSLSCAEITSVSLCTQLYILVLSSCRKGSSKDNQINMKVIYTRSIQESSQKHLEVLGLYQYWIAFGMFSHIIWPPF